MVNPREFHEPYLTRNREILERVRTGDGPGAAADLHVYLQDAEQQLVDAFALQQPAPVGPAAAPGGAG
jgi:hypothetical protein